MSSLLDNKFKETFIDALSTKEAAGAFSDFVDRISNESYKTTEKISLTSLFPKEKPEWFILLLDKVGKDISMNDLRGNLETLKKEILNTEEINIKMPFKPSDNFLKQVQKVFDKAGYKDYLVNLEIDESGGLDTGFSIEGKYLSVSLKEYIRNYLMSKDVFKGKI
ncbi:MAG: hypothetical protein ABIA11_00670 [Patescibacteria group bacterium]|nr:hypothetical protein [Patescibacteria group bacterium]